MGFEVPYLTLIVMAPLTAALLIALVPARAKVTIRVIALVSTVVSLAGSVFLFVTYDRAKAGYQFLEDAAWIPTFGIRYHLGVDGIGLPLLLLTAIVIFCGVLVSWRQEMRQKEFFVLLLVLVTGVFGVFAALDAFLFFFFYEMAVLPMYLLIGVWGSTRKEYAAMKLTLYLFAGSAVLLVGLLVNYFASGTHSFDLLKWAAIDYSHGMQYWLFLAYLIGFGTLIPIWPLHTWSPDGHVAAPTAVSMLHAGVLLKLGAYGIIRFGLGMFPWAAHKWAPVIAVFGVINVVYGAFCAMNQKDLKYVIGYSSVSHMGYVLLGIAALNRLSLEGAVMQQFAHGIMTALFFSLVGYIYEKTHTRQIPELGGLIHQVPTLTAFFIIASSASLGLPSTRGFVAELLVYMGLFARYPIAAFLALVGVVITATYLLRVLQRVFLGEPRPEFDDIKDPPAISLTAMVLLCGIIMTVGLYPEPILSTIEVGLKPLLLKLGGA